MTIFVDLDSCNLVEIILKVPESWHLAHRLLQNIERGKPRRNALLINAS